MRHKPLPNGRGSDCCRVFRSEPRPLGSGCWASIALLLLCTLPAFSQCDSAKCHVGIEPMHASPAVHLTCTDCHGGRADTTDN